MRPPLIAALLAGTANRVFGAFPEGPGLSSPAAAPTWGGLAHRGQPPAQGFLLGPSIRPAKVRDKTALSRRQKLKLKKLTKRQDKRAALFKNPMTGE